MKVIENANAGYEELLVGDRAPKFQDATQNVRCVLGSVFVPGMTIGVPTLSRSSSVHRSLEPTTKKTMSSVKFVTIFRNPSGIKRSFPVMASHQRSEQANISQGIQEDSNYLLKLGIGSVAGAAIIKYASVLFPHITRPNITHALFIIIAPVVIAVILSSSKKQS